MAARLAPGDDDQLHHFVAASVWDAAPLENELLVQADKTVGGSNAVMVIDDTAVPKKGNRNMLRRLAKIQPPDPGITDARPWRSASDGGVASFSS